MNNQVFKQKENSDTTEHEVSLLPTQDYYKKGQWGQCLDLVLHLCQFSENMLIVSGKNGMGKTTLKNSIKDEASDNFTFYEVDVTKELSGEELIQDISDGLMIDNASSLSEQGDQEQILVLMIDNAEKLPIDQIGTLLELRASSEGFLHIVLFSNTGLEYNILESEWAEEFEKNAHVIDLEPLTLDEVEGLILHEWLLAGNHVELPFSKNELKRIYSLSSGITSEVLKLASESVEGTETTVESTVMSSIFKAISPLLLGIVLLFGIIFALISFFMPDEISDYMQLNNNTGSIEDGSVEKEITSDVILKEPLAKKTTDTSDIKKDIVNQSTTNKVTDNKITSNNNNSNMDNVITNPILKPVDSSDNEKANDDLLTENKKLQDKLASMENKLEDNNKKINEIQEKNKMNSARDILEGRSSNKKLSSAKTLSLLAKHEQDILNQKSDNYTLQILGSGNENNINAFIKSNNLKNAHYYRTNHNSKEWFILVAGNYSNKEEALSSVSKLSSTIKSMKPFARKIDSIQSVISSIHNDKSKK